MSFDSRYQQRTVAGFLVIHFVVDHDLVFGFLHFDHLAELGWLAGFALADHFSRRFKYAQDLAGHVSVPAEDARFGLAHHLAGPFHHDVDLTLYAFQRGLFHPIGGTLHATGDLSRETFRLRHHPPRGGQRFAVNRRHCFLSTFPFDSGRAPDPHHIALYAAHTVAQLGSGFTGQGRDLLHQSRQHTRAVAQQAAVGRIVNIGFHYRRVHAHAPALDDLVLHASATIRS